VTAQGPENRGRLSSGGGAADGRAARAARATGARTCEWCAHGIRYTHGTRTRVQVHTPRHYGSAIARWCTGCIDCAAEYGTPCLVCGAPILHGIGHDAGCMVGGA